MASLLRSSDALVRWGGDEFLLLLAGTPAHLAIMLARSLCRTVAEADIAAVGGLTLSVGLAVWEQGESASSVLERADRALYKAKRRGRNRVEMAERRPFSEC